jgi:hypothetical protein
MIRHSYQDHPVPDAPTSPGENARVLPAPHVPVPEEQLLNPIRRRRRLYAGDPLSGLLGTNARVVLEQAFGDLQHPAELAELGTAVFIDRPLGYGKKVGEPDHTPLLAHETFSVALAERRLPLLEEMATDILGRHHHLADRTALLRSLPVEGFPIRAVLPPERPVVSLADALRVSEDFVIRRTLPNGLGELLRLFDFSSLMSIPDLDFLFEDQRAIVVRVASAECREGVLEVYDPSMNKRLELRVNPEEGFATRRGVEYPRAGLSLISPKLPEGVSRVIPPQRREPA